MVAVRSRGMECGGAVRALDVYFSPELIRKHTDGLNVPIPCGDVEGGGEVKGAFIQSQWPYAHACTKLLHQHAHHFEVTLLRCNIEGSTSVTVLSGNIIPNIILRFDISPKLPHEAHNNVRVSILACGEQCLVSRPFVFFEQIAGPAHRSLRDPLLVKSGGTLARAAGVTTFWGHRTLASCVFTCAASGLMTRSVCACESGAFL